ncbi:MAG: phytanoyl-CoA dioxygenase family protein [Planctomycetota bacterium]|nr:phytanoyl-CoA dioxygenase family protein [Planctomycetota bacterium]MDA1248039.1 phytanoyl-CoA dioxygenase family protein [Planctomycetota bacterium]
MLDVRLDQAKQEFDELGYAVFENFIPPGWLAELQAATARQFQIEGEQAGSEFRQEEGSRRLANLVNKGEVFQRVVVEPRLLGLVELVISGGFKLSSLNVRSANPHNGIGQPLHADMGAVADERGFWVCNSVWMLDDFTADNGPLRVVPGSHHWGQTPQETLEDPSAPHPEEAILTGKAGTVVVMNAHCWHGGQANRTDRPRTALHAFFSRRDKPQQQYQKRLIDPELQQTFSPELRAVLALDDPLNDEVTANSERMTGFLKS